MIPFNKPFLTGKEFEYIRDAIDRCMLSGNGDYTKRCHAFLKERYGFPFVLLTTSCTDALEMSSLLLDVGPGDEVIVPSYTFVSSANAFRLRGADVVFADSSSEHPNVTAETIRECISPKTKAIVVVHYAGIAVDMDPIMELARERGIYVVEDAAQAIESTYKGRPLGTIGDISTFSFHETKNVICGEGGLLVVNNPEFQSRAEVLWEKGTNRASFFRGEVGKYEWIDLGSSYLPSELCAAFLLAQLEDIERIQERRMNIWNTYWEAFSEAITSSGISLPHVPSYSGNNGHLFYLECSSLEQRNALIDVCAENQIKAIFHYLPLHLSPYHLRSHSERRLANAERFADCILRLPIFFEMTDVECEKVSNVVLQFLNKH